MTGDHHDRTARRATLLITAADEILGTHRLIKAIEAVFPRSLRMRCWFHRLANIRAKLPDDEAAEVMAHLYAVRDAPTLDAARAAAGRPAPTPGGSRPRWPASRTTGKRCCRSTGSRSATASGCAPPTWPNGPSREERRRTKVIPRLMSEKATMNLAFATMIRASERWCRVSVNDIERHQLRLLRAELGLDPPPTEDHATRRRRTTDRAAA
jgi:putative transposase